MKKNIKIKIQKAKYGWKTYKFYKQNKFINSFAMSYVYYCISEFSKIKTIINQKNRKKIELLIDVEGYIYYFKVKRINEKILELIIGPEKEIKKTKRIIKNGLETRIIITKKNLINIIETIEEDFKKNRKNLIENFLSGLVRIPLL